MPDNIVKFPEIPEKRCKFCGHEATLLCDKVKGEYRTFICSHNHTKLEVREGLWTCDNPICEKCATHIDGADYCPDCISKIKKALKGE